MAVTRWPLKLPPLCGFKLVTGWPCPTCGMTRACCAMANGQWEQALQYHIAVLPLAIVVAATVGLLVMEAVTGRPFVEKIWDKTQRVVLTVLITAVTAGWALNLRVH